MTFPRCARSCIRLRANGITRAKLRSPKSEKAGDHHGLFPEAELFMSFTDRREDSCGDSVVDAHQRKHEFERLALPLLNSLFAFARWLTRNNEEAEDLVQETFMKAWKNYGSFREDCTFRTWIFRILRNTFLSAKVASHTTLEESLDEEKHSVFLPYTNETPETILLCSAHISTIRNALEELPLPLREIILLREVEEMSYHEIRTILNVPLGTVMSRLARARQALREVTLSKLGGLKK